eukprot:TRINITY_DN63589_c0_g1_i1.p1 TRINITY_DN63589_c0_g1~~TRINITY_DN63589_c0_g1_i1.p1  ORF type:complete len:291 (+),score=25.21 TRINITY_DN63589_c0_g1_i1:64-873(+)
MVAMEEPFFLKHRRGRILRTIFCACVGALLAVLAGALVSCSLLDIAFEPWARYFYALTYFSSALLLLCVRNVPFIKSITSMFVGTATLNLYIEISPVGTAPIVVRIIVFSFIGMTLCFSVVGSCTVCLHLIVEVALGRFQFLEESLAFASSGRLSYLFLLSLIEGVYFGFIFGLLEEHSVKPHVLQLPRHDPALSLPIAAILGGLVGARLENLRQKFENPYAAIRFASGVTDMASLPTVHGNHNIVPLWCDSERTTLPASSSLATSDED